MDWHRRPAAGSPLTMNIVMALGIVVAGCGNDVDNSVTAVGAASELTATCGPITFGSVPPDLDEFPTLDDDANAALDELVSGPTGVEAGGFDTDFQWSIASRTDDQLVLFGQGSEGTSDEPSLAHARFQRIDGSWSPSGWGGCQLQMEAAGLGPAAVASVPGEPPDPNESTLSLLIKELDCASGRAPVDRDVVPVVTETDESVIIVVLVAPVQGDAECPDNPWHPITVTLDEPLGDRQLLDGHRYPPRVVVEADRDG